MLRPLLLAVLLLGALAARAQAPRVVTLAVDDAHPPYAYAQDGQAAGIYVQLLQRAVQGLNGWELQLVSRPWVRALQESRAGGVDGVLPPYQLAERDWIAIYVGPLYRELVILSCSAASGLGPDSRWPDDFLRRRIGTTRGYLLSDRLVEAFRSQKLSRHDYRNARDALAALAGGEIDCYANDARDIGLARAQAASDPVWAARMPTRLEAPFVLSNQQAFVGFSKRSLAQRPELAEFARALDARLAQLRASGEAQRIIDAGLTSR